MIDRLDPLAGVTACLAEGGFTVERRSDECLGEILVAETDYALAMAAVLPGEDWREFVEDAQAELTRLAAIHPSPRSWDLYLVLVVDDASLYERAREAYEADTRYARKLFARGDRAEIERAVSSLLPLRPLPELRLPDPLVAVEEELLASGLEPDLVKAAVSSFAQFSEVRIP